jgi:hypothetical protein
MYVFVEDFAAKLPQSPQLTVSEANLQAPSTVTHITIAHVLGAKSSTNLYVQQPTVRIRSIARREIW